MTVRVLKAWPKWAVFPFGKILGKTSVHSDSIAQVLRYHEEVNLELQMERADKS